jgi:probable rRNA maturation factor
MPMKAAKAASRGRASLKRRKSAASSAQRLTIQNATRSSRVPPAAHFRKWIHATLRGRATVTIRLVGLAEARELNRAYRRKDYATNVLTFVLRDTRPLEGDIALCVPVIAQEARSQRKPLEAHYAHLTVHAILHLQGYEHDRHGDARRMESLEKRILKKLGYTDPYAAIDEHG